jgi:hypothetical protein
MKNKVSLLVGEIWVYKILSEEEKMEKKKKWKRKGNQNDY